MWKRRQKGLLIKWHFYWLFLSDIMALKGLSNKIIQRPSCTKLALKMKSGLEEGTGLCAIECPHTHTCIHNGHTEAVLSTLMEIWVINNCLRRYVRVSIPSLQCLGYTAFRVYACDPACMMQVGWNYLGVCLRTYKIYVCIKKNF